MAYATLYLDLLMCGKFRKIFFFILYGGSTFSFDFDSKGLQKMLLTILSETLQEKRLPEGLILRLPFYHSIEIDLD